MAKNIAVLFLSGLWVSCAGTATAECPSTIGEYVPTETPQSVFRQLSAYQLIKDEFETSADYAQRRQSVLSGLSPMIVKGQIDPEFLDSDTIFYEADRQRFVVQQYAFDSIATPPKAYYAPRSLAHSDDKGQLLTSEDISVKLFEASRGAKYWLLDRYLKLGERRGVWAADDRNYKINNLGRTSSNWVNFIYVSPDKARELKTNLKLAYYFKPKEPVFFIREWIQGSSRKVTENVIVGELRCVLFLDGDNRLLKTIRSSLYYQPAPQPRPPVPAPIAIAPSPEPQPIAPTPIAEQSKPVPKPKPKPKPNPKPVTKQVVASAEESLDAPKDDDYKTGGGF